MQISRLFEIVYILLDKEKVTARELAEHFEVSPRTIYRDIEILSGAGIPVYMSKGRNGGVFLLQEFVLNKSIITKEEKKEILSALRAVNSVQSEEAGATLRKLSSIFGQAGTDWIEVNFGAWSDGETEKAIFRNLREAILSEKVVRFSYANVKGQVTKREVEPIRLVFQGEAWYLYGYCRMREDFRFFKLRRIREPEVTEENFRREVREIARKKQEYYASAERVLLKLKIEKEAAYRVYDEFRDYEQLEDGSFLVEIEFEKNEWLLYYLLSFGQHLEVLEPLEIREWLIGEVQGILKRYDGK